MSEHINQQQALLQQTAQDKQIPVDELSGDEGMQKTVMITFSSQPKANMFQTATTVIKTIVGSGIISLPYTVSVMGWAFSLILFSIMGIANQHTVHILLKCKNLCRHSTYNSIAYYLYPSKFCTFLLSFLNCFGNVGFVVAMMSILKGALRKLLVELIGHDSSLVDDFYVSEWFIMILTSLLLAPTVVIQKIEALKYFSIIGVVAIVLAIVSLFVIFFVEMSQRNWQNQFTLFAFPSDGTAVLSVFPNIVFALVYQSNFFSIYKGLENPTDTRTLVSNGIGLAFSTILYIILGIMGFCLYGSSQEYVDANFLLEVKLQQTNTILFIGIYVGFLISDIFCIPVTFLVARNNLIAIVKLFKSSKPVKRSQRKQYSAIEQIGSFTQGNSKQEIKKKAKIMYYVYTLSLYAVCVIITILVTSLAAVFNIVGAIASSAISFVIPYMFYFLLIKRQNKPKNIHYFLSLAGIIIFVPLGILSVVSLYL